MRLACTHAVAASVHAVDRAHSAAGASSIYSASPLDRCFRDVHSVAAHAFVRQTTMADGGQLLLGQEPAFRGFQGLWTFKRPGVTAVEYSVLESGAGSVKRPARMYPVPVFRFLAPNRRAPGSVQNSPGQETQFCTELSLWVKPRYNPQNNKRPRGFTRVRVATDRLASSALGGQCSEGISTAQIIPGGACWLNRKRGV